MLFYDHILNRIRIGDSSLFVDSPKWKYNAVNYNDLLTKTGMNENDLSIVYNGQGVWLINRKPKGVYIYQGGEWVYANEELQNKLYEVSFIKVDEGGGVGFVINGQDRSQHNPVGAGTLELSVGDASLNPRGHTGQQSIINGYNMLGSGYAVIGSGWDNRNNGNYCIVTGISNDTFGVGCVVSGVALSNQGGDLMGLFGAANELPSSNVYGLIVGNGTYTTTGSRVFNPLVRSDAFRVHNRGVNNGGIEAPSITNQIINSLGAKSLVSKEYVDKFYQFFQGTGTEYVGQTTIPLMNQQANVFETYIEKSFLITRTDNYRIDLSFISSLNTPNYDFIALLDINDGTTTETLTIQTEPKDSVGTGILVDVIQGGVIQPQVITSTNQRNATTFAFNRQLVAGLTYTFTLRFGSDNANRRATMYQAQVMIEQKTLIL